MKHKKSGFHNSAYHGKSEVNKENTNLTNRRIPFFFDPKPLSTPEKLELSLGACAATMLLIQASSTPCLDKP